jgi:hypothetical protein
MKSALLAGLLGPIAMVALSVSGETAALTHPEATLGGASATCQLSIPTIDTVVAPRANGYRNPGTRGAFVICGIVSPVKEEMLSVGMVLLSLDGQAHEASCTGVNGIPGVVAQSYLTRSFVVPAGGHALSFTPADFGGSTTIPNSQAFTITCNLPPQTAISYIGGSYNLDVGM